MRGMQGTRGIVNVIPENFSDDTEECCHSNIPGNIQEDSAACSRRFRDMLKNIPENAQEDSGKYLKKFHRMFEKIPEKVQEDFRKFSSEFWEMLTISS